MEKTVIISCAGKGTRLGKGIPKCLVQINGKSLIEIQLEQLKDVSDVRIVVGFKKEMVIEKLKELNFEGKIFVNSNYENTGTAGSFCSAIDESIKDLVIALDGDLIVNSDDMKEVLLCDEEIICGEKINTDNPVLISLNDNNEVISFSRDKGQYEWAGLAQIKKEHLIYGTNHVYQLLEGLLPMKFKLIRAKEIDTPNDLEKADLWVKDNCMNEKNIIDNWFKSRFDIEDNYIVSRHSKNDRIDYDIALINRFIDKNSSILDLGCGTGIIEERLHDKVKYIKAIDKYEEFLKRASISKNIEYLQHDMTTFKENKIYNLILMFGVTIYFFDDDLYKIINNCSKMMDNSSILIIKNQWSTNNDDLIVNKQYSSEDKNQYYAIYRSLLKMKKLLIDNGLNADVFDIYPSYMSLYKDTHEYALICKKDN